MTYRYRLHGMDVHSVVQLEAEPAPLDDAPADLALLVGPSWEVPAEVPAGHQLAVFETPEHGLRHAVVQTRGGWLIRFPGGADVELDGDLRTATAHLDPAFPPELFSVLAAGFVVATVLQLRGDAVLHASAVEVGGRALAVVGPSGTGKSTTATLLCSAGARLVSDDVLRVALGGAGPRTWRGPSSTRLRAQAAPLAPGTSRQSADGRTVARLVRASEDELPLGAVLLPRPQRATDDVCVVRLTGMTALMPLVSAPRILGWCDGASLATQMRQLSALAAAVPVVEVHMPWGPPFSDTLGVEVLAALEQDQVAMPAGPSPSTA